MVVVMDKSHSSELSRASTNSTSYIFDGLVEDDGAEVKALLACQQRYVEKYSPIKQYLFDTESTDAAFASLPGIVASAYRIKSLSDPVPDEDNRELVSALTNSAGHSLSQGGIGLGSPNAPFSYQKGDEELNPTEVVIDSNGQPRQVGATTAEGEYIKRYKRRAEESLFIF